MNQDLFLTDEPFAAAALKITCTLIFCSFTPRLLCEVDMIDCSTLLTLPVTDFYIIGVARTHMRDIRARAMSSIFGADIPSAATW